MSFMRPLLKITYLSAFFASAAVMGGGVMVPAAKAGGWDCWDGCYAETWSHPIKRTITKRIEIEPKQYEVLREPAQYGWVKKYVLSEDDGLKPQYKTVKKRILLKQYKNIAIFHGGKYQLVRKRVEIYPEVYGDNGRYSSKD